MNKTQIGVQNILSFIFRNGTLDFLIADTPILDYYRATDQGCKLQKVGDPVTDDAYAVGMTKGFPLKVSEINQLVFICQLSNRLGVTMR